MRIQQISCAGPAQPGSCNFAQPGGMRHGRSAHDHVPRSRQPFARLPTIRRRALLLLPGARAWPATGRAGLASEQWAPLVEQAMLVFLLLLGYAGLGFSLNRQAHPISAQGLPRRRGMVARGGPWGWHLAGRCSALRCRRWWLPAASPFAFPHSCPPGDGCWSMSPIFRPAMHWPRRLLFAATPSSASPALSGSAGAVLGFAALYAFLQSFVAGIQPRQHRGRIGVHNPAFHRLPAHPGAVGELGPQLRLEGQPRPALRLRHQRRQQPFAGGAGRSHGLVLADRRRFRPRRQLVGAFWSWWPRSGRLPATRDLDYKYNAPEIVAGGIPVDLDAAARRQHEAAMGAPAARRAIQSPVQTPGPDRPRHPRRIQARTP